MTTPQNISPEYQPLIDYLRSDTAELVNQKIDNLRGHLASTLEKLVEDIRVTTERQKGDASALVRLETKINTALSWSESFKGDLAEADAKLTALRAAEVEIRGILRAHGTAPGAPTDFEVRGEMQEMKAKIAAFELLFLGDVELKAKWERGKLNVPCIAEPPGGLVEQVQKQLAAIGKLTEEVTAKLGVARKLDAFFGPLLEGKSPPLNGDEIVSKAWVDKSIATFAGAVRKELAGVAEDLARRLVETRDELVGVVAATRQVADHAAQFTNEICARERDFDVHDRLPSQVVVGIVERIAMTYRYVKDRATEADRERPSRLGSLIHLITGRTLDR